MSFLLLNHIRLQAANVLANYATVRMGIVDTYDPQTFTCVVRFQPEDAEHPEASLSSALPIAALAIGNGFGVMCAPNIGDQVAVHFEAGSNQVGFVCGGLFSIQDQPPPINAGEYYLIHQTGSFIKLMNSGDLLINGHTQLKLSAPNVTITTTADTSIQAQGNVTIHADGNVGVEGKQVSIAAQSIELGTGQGEHLTLFDALQTWAEQHTHTDSQGKPTSPPLQALPSAAATTIVKAQ